LSDPAAIVRLSVGVFNDKIASVSIAFAAYLLRCSLLRIAHAVSPAKETRRNDPDRGRNGRKALIRYEKPGPQARPVRLDTPVLAACLFFVAPALAAPAHELRFRLIDGQLCVKAELRGPESRVPGYLVIDLGTRGPLLLHERTAALLGAVPRGPVDIVAADSGTVLPQLEAVSMAIEPLERLTRDHAAELENIPAVGVLGMPAFRGARIELDVGDGRIRWGEDVSEPGAAPDSEGGIDRVPFEAEAYGYWLVGTVPDHGTVRIRFATAEYDTRISNVAAARLGAPGGDLEALLLGGVNLARYAVLRPSDFSAFPEPRPDVVIGTGLLSHFVVTIAPDARWLSLRSVREPEDIEAERSFFVARAAKQPEAIEAFLAAHPESRLAAQACETLLWLRVERKPPDLDAVRGALEWIARTTKAERRAMRLVAVADEMIALDESRDDAYELASLALDAAAPYAGDDLNETAAYHIRARRGLIALLRGDYETARRELLSAAFGIPKDPYVNLWLGRLYERTGQAPRAWSRYVQSAMQNDPPIGALRGLNRLNNDPAFRRRFTMDDAARLLEGRAPKFVPAQRYEPGPANRARPVRLMELFTNINQEQTQAAQLAFEGLAGFYELADTVCVQYHLDDVLSTDSAVARAAWYGVETVPAAFFDGMGPITAGGNEDAAARVFSTYRDKSMRPRSPEDAPEIRGEARWRNDNLEVGVEVGGVEGTSLLGLHVLLCERSVMAIGANRQLLHKNVVRAALTPPEGEPLGEGPMFFEGGRSAIQQRLRQRIAAQFTDDSGRPAMEPVWIDPAACVVVAFVQNQASHEVLAATTFAVENPVREGL
jgi:hypothetical protein